jgi:hypothetical protein
MASDLDGMQERLDNLEADTEAVREKAEADGLLPEDDPADMEPTLANPDPQGGDHGEGVPGTATG